MPRPRFAPIFTLALTLCLALAGGAVAKPHKKAAPLRVDAPRAASLPAGIPTKVKVQVANRGSRPIAGVVLLAKASKQVSVKPAKAKVGKLKARQTKAVTFTVSVAKAGKPKLRFVAKARRQKPARDAIALKVGPGPKEEPKKAPEIIGHYFWNSQYVVTTTYIHGFYVVDEHWIYRGIPKEGPPSCTTQTTFNEDDDGCIPYTWDEASGALTVGTAPGEYKVGSHLLKIGTEAFSEAVMPEAGAKFDASGSYINQFGICPLSCSFVTVDLQLSANGEFARASGVAGFFGEGGSYGAVSALGVIQIIPLIMIVVALRMLEVRVQRRAEAAARIAKSD